MSRITKIGIPSGGTTSQVLVKNSNTDYDVTWGTGGGGGITGSGTSGYVTFWNGSSTVTGEANLFWDATNDRLGIGTSSPAFPLDVNGTARTGTITINTNGQGRTIGTYYGSGTDGSNIWIGGGGLSSQFLSITSDGSYNASLGVNALLSNTTGQKNVGIAPSALYSTTSGGGNIGIGFESLYTNTTGIQNIAIGLEAGRSGTGVQENVILGAFALRSNTGSYNIAIGARAGFGLSTGSVNANTSGSNNIFIGYAVVGLGATQSNKIFIGAGHTDNYIAGNFNIKDGNNFILDTTTGTKFGTSTTQKIGFFNATPVVQPSAVTSAQGIADALTSLGLLASSTISGGGSTYSISTKTTTYNETATSGEIILLGDTTTAGFTITLPSAVSNTAKITIKKIAGTNNLTIDGNGSQTIDGGLTAVLVRVYESITLVSDNSNWHII